MRTFVHVIYVMFGDNKGNKKGWNPSEGFSLIFSRIKKFYRTAIYKNIEGIPMRDAFCDYIEFRIIV